MFLVSGNTQYKEKTEKNSVKLGKKMILIVSGNTQYKEKTEKKLGKTRSISIAPCNYSIKPDQIQRRISVSLSKTG